MGKDSERRKDLKSNMPITSKKTALQRITPKTDADGIETGSKDMVDFKRLSQIKEAARLAIEEEEKHSGPFTREERRMAEMFFLRGANWQEKVTGA